MVDEIKLLVAIDPGETTGGAYFHIEIRHIQLFQYPDTAIPLFLEGMVTPHHVVYEQFRLYPQAARRLIMRRFVEVEVVGMLLYYCSVRGILMTPVMARAWKQVIGNQFRVKGMPHAQDALGIGMWWLHKYLGKSWEDLEEWDLVKLREEG